jgi:TolA-binding protein
MGFGSILWSGRYLIIIAIIGLVLTGSWAYIGVVKAEKTAALSQIESLNEQLRLSNSNTTRLQSSISTQNQQIVDFQDAADKRASDSKPATDKAKQDNIKARQSATDIINRKPTPETTSCADATKLLNEEIANAIK